MRISFSDIAKEAKVAVAPRKNLLHRADRKIERWRYEGFLCVIYTDELCDQSAQRHSLQGYLGWITIKFVLAAEPRGDANQATEAASTHPTAFGFLLPRSNLAAYNWLALYVPRRLSVLVSHSNTMMHTSSTLTDTVGRCGK